MTMFKVKRGLETELPVEKSNGTLYFCTDTGNIYIDMGDQRKQISAEKALLDAEGRNIIETYATKTEVTTLETDPTVPAWAKKPEKPTYTAEEVGTYTKVEIDNLELITVDEIDEIKIVSEVKVK